MSNIRLIIVDDHEIVRHGLRSFLDLLDDIDVVGEGSNGHDAVALARDTMPDVILLDLIMPEMDGVEATRQIRKENPDAKIVILSSYSNEDKVMPALEAGATGYLLKDMAPDDLATAIRETYRGQTQLHPEITRQLMAKLQNPGESPSGPAALDTLTDREIDVLKLIARGLSNDEIAFELHISSLTVKTHVSNLLGKLDLADRTQAAIYAIRHGVAPLNPADTKPTE